MGRFSSQEVPAEVTAGNYDLDSGHGKITWSVNLSRPMTYIVTDACVKCKFMDCVEVCPVDCFYEGENFLVIGSRSAGGVPLTVMLGQTLAYSALTCSHLPSGSSSVSGTMASTGHSGSHTTLVRAA